MDLVTFLRARLDEDEAMLAMPEFIARALPGSWGGRARREVEAKRRILDWSQELDSYYEAQEVLGLLAAPYSDHPDYDPEWKP